MVLHEILKNPESEAVALLVAVDKLFKGQCFAWEFDTLFSELEDEHGIVLSPEASDRLMALLAIKLNPAHLWDGSVFANIVESLNHNECLVDTYEQCSPGEILWALKQLEILGEHYSLSLTEEMFNDEPKIYIACCVAADGWFVLPEEFKFCSEEYSRTNRLDRHASIEKEEQVLALIAKKEFEFTDEEDPIQVQIAKIREAYAYRDYREGKLRDDLARLATTQ